MLDVFSALVAIRFGFCWLPMTWGLAAVKFKFYCVAVSVSIEPRLITKQAFALCGARADPPYCCARKFCVCSVDNIS